MGGQAGKYRRCSRTSPGRRRHPRRRHKTASFSGGAGTSCKEGGGRGDEHHAANKDPLRVCASRALPRERAHDAARCETAVCSPRPAFPGGARVGRGAGGFRAEAGGTQKMPLSVITHTTNSRTRACSSACARMQPEMAGASLPPRQLPGESPRAPPRRTAWGHLVYKVIYSWLPTQ